MMCHKLLVLYAILMDFIIHILITVNIMLIEIMTNLLNVNFFCQISFAFMDVCFMSLVLAFLSLDGSENLFMVVYRHS